MTDKYRHLSVPLVDIDGSPQRLEGYDDLRASLSTAEATIQQLAAEVMAAINEPMYAGTRKAWVDRAYAAEARLSEVEAERDRLKAALDQIASWMEGPVVNGTFDEPWSAKIARAALTPQGQSTDGETR